MTRNETAAIAVLQNQMSSVLAWQSRSDDASNSLHEKLDQIIAGQAAGASDRAALRKDIQDMRPHVETISNAKIFGAWSVKIGGGITAFGGFVWGAWDHLKALAVLFSGR